MSGYCKMPTSALHKRLINESGNAEWANSVYAFTQTVAFKKLFGDKVIYDSNKEPTFESLISLFNVQKVFDPAKYMAKLEESLNENLPDYNYDIIERAVDFNKNNSQYYAKVVDLNGSKSRIIVTTRTGENDAEANNLEQNLKMFRSIDTFLKSLGLEISILDPSYLHNEDGLFVPSSLNKVVKGTLGVINIANNFAGFKALPEEFGHFLVECCKDKPIIQRCETFLSEHMELCQAILQDEFETVRDYYHTKGRPELLFREVMGRIVARYLNSEAIDTNTLLSRGEDAIRRFIESTFQIRNNEQKDAFNVILGLLGAVNELVNFANNANEENGNIQKISHILDDVGKTSQTLAHASVNIHTDLDTIEKSLLANVEKYMNIYKKHNVQLAASLEALFGSSLKRKNLKEGWIREYRNILQGVNIADDDLKMLCDEYATLKYLQSVFSSSTDFLKDLYQKFERLSDDLKNNFDFYSLTNNASVIRGLRNFILVYRENVQDLRTAVEVISKRNLQTDVGLQQLKDFDEHLDRLDIAISKMDTKLYTVSKQLVYNFCLPFFNENLEDQIKIAGTSISKEVVLKLSHVLNNIDGDINPVKMWVDTAYNSPDIFTQVISSAIKSQQDKIYRQSQEAISELNILASKYDVRHTEYAYEVDEKGEWTGYYVNKYGINFAKFQKEKKKDFDEIDNDPNLNSKQKLIAKAEWYRQHTYTIYVDNYIQDHDTGMWVADPNESHKVGITVPYKESRWSSDAYDRLSTSQQAFCDRILEIKHKLDAINGLQGSKQYFKCVQKMINSGAEASLSPTKGVWKRLLGNKLKLTQEDTEFGQIETRNETQTVQEDQRFLQRLKGKLRQILADDESSTTVTKTLTDFEHNIYHTVPMNYVADLSDINRHMLSTNTVDTLLHYSVATYQHAGMAEIADLMELALDIAKHRHLIKYDDSGHKLVSRSANTDDDDVLADVFEDSSGARVNQQLEYFVRSQIYSEYKDKGTTILNGRVSTSKLSDGILRLTSLGLLGYNPFTAINNVLVGRSQMFIEGFFGKDTFTLEALRKARREYYRLLIDGGIGELNAISKDSRLYVLAKVFDPEKDWIQEELSKGIYKPTTLRLMEKFGPSFMMAAGEHYLKFIGLIATLYSIPMLDAHGDETTLYDALEMTDIETKEGISKTFKIRDGFTKPDGSEWTFTAKRGLSDLQMVKRRVTIANHKMHGIYDREDYIMLKKGAAGRLISQFRNYLVPYMQKRWKGLGKKQPTYNLLLRSTDDGIYVTALKFIKQLVFPNTEFITNTGNIDSRLKALIDGLSEQERANLNKFLGEMLATLCTVVLMATAFRDWDDDEDIWSLRATNYFIRRLHTELTYGYSLSSLTDILQSPAVVMGPFQDFMKVIKSIGDDHVLQSGPYKGDTRFKANVKRAMPIIPNIYDFFHLDTENKRYKIWEDSFWHRKSNDEQKAAA